MSRPDPDLDPSAEPAEASTPKLASGSRRGITIPPAVRRPAVLAIIGVTVVAIVAGTLAAALQAPRGTDTAQRSAGPSLGPGPSSGGGAGDLSFHPIPGTAAKPIARLTAAGANGPVVPLDASFRLEAASDTPAGELAGRLTIEPKVELAARAEGPAVVLTPSAPLTAGTVYRFALRGATGELLDTWAFQAKQPLRIVGTLPGDREADIPLDTGIEVTFDQDGVVDAERHLTIAPATPGRFEMHGRTLAFVPSRPLERSTLYTVTVSPGIAVGTTGEATIEETRFQFETGVGETGGDADPLSFRFNDVLGESPTTERPAIGVWTFGGDPDHPPKTIHLSVYRLDGLDAAVAAWRTLRARPSWTRWSTVGLVDPTPLQRVVDADLTLRAIANAFFVELPDRLAAGWYLVDETDGARPAQQVLQVSDVSGYLAVSDTRTIVWTHDLATGRPIAGATASAGTAAIGRSNANGLVDGPTPAALLPEAGASCKPTCEPVVVVRAADGRSVFLPAATGLNQQFDKGGYVFWDADPGWWSLLHTDRTRYRVGDAINVWGMARNRDTGSVPERVRVSVLAAESEDGDAPAIITEGLPTLATGAFSGSISMAGLPAGNYRLALSIGDRTLRSTFVTVGTIAKPAYTLTVTTARRVYLDGERVRVRVAARFFEGTPVTGVPLRIEGAGDGTATTGLDGTAAFTGTASVDDDVDGPQERGIDVAPSRPEEAEIGAASEFIVVFPSSRTIDATARIADGRVRASGSVHLVAVRRLERALADGASFWDLDPRGAALANATVTVRFVERIPKRTQVGTQYDFIEKKVVPVYEIDVIERAAGTVTVRTDANGRWIASLPASATDHDYEVRASVRDPQGRIVRAGADAPRRTDIPDIFATSPSLDLTAGDRDDSATFAIGDVVDLTMSDPNLAQSADDGTTYLFFSAQRGIHDVSVQASRRYRVRFPAWGVPNLSIAAVRFTGRTYVGAAWYNPAFRLTDRRLDVELTTDAARYAPGGTATVRVRTTVHGAPVAATVVLRAVDEKLFTIDAAAADDPLNELYAGVPTGVESTYASHEHPRSQPEGGDTTGGGGDDRDDFRDSLLFRTITTGADGRGQVTFELSDDLTSWRVTGSAITRRLQAGVGTVLVPVGLPFFVDASVGAEYLVADRPSVAVRAYGNALAAGQGVTIQVSSASLGFDSGPVATKAFATVEVPLPTLRPGTQTLTISASTGTGSTRRTDRLTRTFTVTTTRLTGLRSAAVDLPATGPFAGGTTGFTILVVSDAAAGRYDALLAELAAGGGARLDRALAADVARGILQQRSGAPADAGATAFDVARYTARDGGLAVVPYASSDVEMSAYAALVAPDRLDREALRRYFTAIRASAEETRERQILALVGLAGLGEPVLPALGAEIAVSDLTVREQLSLGLAAATVGDGASARRILSGLVTAYGEEAGELARLRTGTTAADVTEATALAAFLAAKLGDPVAPAFWAYVATNPARDRIEALTGIGFAEAMLDHLAAGASSFAWTLGNDRHVVDLERGASFRLVLTPDQLGSIAIERLAGQLRVTTTWRDAIVPATLAADPDMTMTRSVRPGTAMAGSDLAVVELKVTFGAQAATGCREVTDPVPSGLAPVGSMARWYDPDEGGDPPDETLVLPYAQDGQRVSFCVGPTDRNRAFTLRYVARVVSTGTYAWEPAIAQDPSGQGPAAVTEASSIAIH